MGQMSLKSEDALIVTKHDLNEFYMSFYDVHAILFKIYGVDFFQIYFY